MRYEFATIYIMPDNYFTSYTPRVRVKIRDINTGEEKCDLTDDLLSISTNKAYGRCTGTWQLMLPHRLDVNEKTAEPAKKEEPQKPEPPTPEPYDCEGAKQKISNMRSEYKTMATAYNNRLAAWKSALAAGTASEGDAEDLALMEESKKVDSTKQSFAGKINDQCDEAVSKGCDQSAFDTLRSPPKK